MWDEIIEQKETTGIALDGTKTVRVSSSTYPNPPRLKVSHSKSTRTTSGQCYLADLLTLVTNLDTHTYQVYRENTEDLISMYIFILTYLRWIRVEP
jgi:hypothetical protein